MSAPYPAIHRWVVASSILPTTRKAVHEAGQGLKESGALWLGQRTETAKISAVVLLRGNGVEQSSGSWKVRPEVFGAVTRWARPQGLTLLAVVHTHLRGVPPRLSRADHEYSVQVPGVLAVVIGDGGAEADYHRWGWYVHENDRYICLNRNVLAARLILEDDYPFDFREADAEGLRVLTP